MKNRGRRHTDTRHRGVSNGSKRAASAPRHSSTQTLRAATESGPIKEIGKEDTLRLFGPANPGQDESGATEAAGGTSSGT